MTYCKRMKSFEDNKFDVEDNKFDVLNFGRFRLQRKIINFLHIYKFKKKALESF